MTDATREPEHLVKPLACGLSYGAGGRAAASGRECESCVVCASRDGCLRSGAGWSLLPLKSPGDAAKKGETKAKCEGEEGQEFCSPALAGSPLGAGVLGLQCWDKSTKPVADWEGSGLWLSKSCSSPGSQKQGHMHVALPARAGCDLGMGQEEPCSSAW